MITGYKKALLTTAVVMAVSGFNVYAAPDIANSNMSQSEMYNVTQEKQRVRQAILMRLLRHLTAARQRLCRLPVIMISLG